MREKIIIVILKMDSVEKDTKQINRLATEGRVKVELLSVSNIIEIEKIKSILINHPDLLSFFQIMCEIVNEEINDE
jgi:putative ribosome biogenesis GTPase RsgA